MAHNAAARKMGGRMTTLNKDYLARRFLIAGLVCLAAFTGTGFVGWRTITSANIANSYQSAFHQLAEVTYDFALKVNEAQNHHDNFAEMDRVQLSATLDELAHIYSALRQVDPDGLEAARAASVESYSEQHLDESIEQAHSENLTDHEPPIYLPARMPPDLYGTWEENLANGGDSLESVIGNVLVLGRRFVNLHNAQHDSASLDALRREIVRVVRHDAAPAMGALRAQMAAKSIHHTKLVKPLIIFGAFMVLGSLVLVWLAIFKPMNVAILKAHTQTAAERDRAITSERAKSEFLAVVSHEIRTPMNAVIGFTDLLKQSGVNEEQLDYLEIIRTSGNDLMEILNEILDYSKLESGRYALESLPFKLQDLTESVTRLLGPQFTETGLALVTYIDPALPEELVSDIGAIRQVLFNLVGNAIKFTEEGAVAIEVRRDHSDETGQCFAEFLVTDTGIGIPKEKLNHVFQAFTQADSSDRRQYGGTGLGLAISRRLIELLGGHIQAESILGQGTQMRFTVPLDMTAPTSSAVPRRMDMDLQGLSVLIMDLSDLRRKVTTTVLESLGTNVSAARNLSGAKRKIEAAAHKGIPIQVAVFDDSAVPTFDRTILEELKSASGELELQIILVSGQAIEGPSKGVDQNTAAAVCPKPLVVQDLVALIHQVAMNRERSNSSDDLGEVEAVAEVPAADATRPSHSPAATHKGTILLAEDNIPNQRLLNIALTQVGYVVHVVANGKNAVDAAGQFAYDAILVDRNMPVMDGIAAIELIRASDGPSANAPIVAVSASAFEKDRDDFLASGADDFLTKPIDLDIAIARIQQWTASGRSTPQQPPPASQNVA